MVRQWLARRRQHLGLRSIIGIIVMMVVTVCPMMVAVIVTAWSHVKVRAEIVIGGLAIAVMVPEAG